MSQCYKCERELPDGQVECPACMEGASELPSDEQLEQWDEEFARDYMQIDWTKVKTLRHLIGILATHGEPIFIQKDSPEFEELKPFLKPIDE